MNQPLSCDYSTVNREFIPANIAEISTRKSFTVFDCNMHVSPGLFPGGDRQGLVADHRSYFAKHGIVVDALRRQGI
jgi:hypothetical protein